MIREVESDSSLAKQLIDRVNMRIPLKKDDVSDFIVALSKVMGEPEMLGPQLRWFYNQRLIVVQEMEPANEEYYEVIIGCQKTADLVVALWGEVNAEKIKAEALQTELDALVEKIEAMDD